MIRKIMKKIRAKLGTFKRYQSHKTCLNRMQNTWNYILEQSQLANDQWYVEQQLDTPARESLSGLSDG